MKLKLGKFEIEVVNDKVEIQVSNNLGSNFQSGKVELERIEAVKLRNWLNKFINGTDE